MPITRTDFSSLCTPKLLFDPLLGKKLNDNASCVQGNINVLVNIYKTVMIMAQP